MNELMIEFIFLQNALLAAILVSITSGLIGAIIVANRLVFISGGIAHTAFGGVGMAYYFGISPFLGAFLFTIPAACLMGWLEEKFNENSETLIGLFWASGMALGVVFLDMTPGYKSDLMSYLFGNILTVPLQEIQLMLIANLFIILVVASFYKQILSYSTDAQFARSRTLPILSIKLMLMCLIAISVVLVMRTTGLILMIALFTVPSSIIRRWTTSLVSLMFGSACLCLFFCLGGLMIAYFIDISSGSAIILLSTFIYFLNLLIAKNSV